MAKAKKEKHVEEVVEQEVAVEVEGVEAEEEAKPTGVVMIIADEHGFRVQDGYEFFSDNVERELTDEEIYNLVTLSAEQMKEATIVNRVKAELAKSFGGGQ